MSTKKNTISYLMHEANDTVGVAVVDIKAGSTVRGRSLDGKDMPKLKALSDIPLGHKISLYNLKPSDTVIKYGVDIGRVVAPIKKGEHLHVHNVKTKRW